MPTKQSRKLREKNLELNITKICDMNITTIFTNIIITVSRNYPNTHFKGIKKVPLTPTGNKAKRHKNMTDFKKVQI